MLFSCRYLRILGCGFDFDNDDSADSIWGTQPISSLSNVVSWDKPSQGSTTLGTVVNASYSVIVYELSSTQLSEVSGFLSASVCTMICQISGTGAGGTRIAFVQTTPVLNTVSQVVASNDASITVTGLNFDTTVADNVIEFISTNGPSAPKANVTSITLTTSNTQAVATWTSLTLANYGALQARIGIPGGVPGGTVTTVWSLYASVGTVTAEPPVLESPQDTQITTNVVTISCPGSGFDNSDAENQNIISFFTYRADLDEFIPATASATATQASSRSRLVMRFEYVIARCT